MLVQKAQENWEAESHELATLSDAVPPRSPPKCCVFAGFHGGLAFNGPGFRSILDVGGEFRRAYLLQRRKSSQHETFGQEAVPRMISRLWWSTSSRKASFGAPWGYFSICVVCVFVFLFVLPPPIRFNIFVILISSCSSCSSNFILFFKDLCARFQS